MRSPVLALAAFFSFLLTASAQCPVPQSGFGPGGAGGPVLDFVTADLGSGSALYACGSFSTAGEVVAKGVARFDGQAWAALGAGIEVNGAERVTHLISLDWNGPKLCAVGNFKRAGGQTSLGVALWDGQQWDTLGGGPTTGGIGGTLYSAAVFDEGSGPRLFVGGLTGDDEGNSDPLLARYDGTSWTSVTGTPTTNACPPDDYYCVRRGNVTSLVVWDDGSGRALHVAGDFDHVAGATGFNHARWNGTAWSVPGGVGIGGATGAVSAMTLHDDGSGTALYLQGSFPGGPDPRIVRWNGNAYASFGTSPSVGVADFVSLPASSAGPAGLWVLPTTPANDSIVHAKRWDGASWTAFDIPLDYRGDTNALGVFDAGFGPRLFLGGEFHIVGGVVAGSLASFDGTSWSAMSAGAGITSDFDRPGFVSALCVHDDGSGPALYAGGEIFWSAGTWQSNLVRWNGTAWQPMPGLTNPGSGFYIDTLVSADVGQGPSLYVGGYIKVGGANPVPFARWNGSGFDSAGLLSFTIYDMAAFDAGPGSKLYIAVNSSLMRFDPPNFTSIAFQSTNTTLRSLCVFDDGSGPALYVGGSFTGFGGSTSSGVVRWNGTTWSAVGAGLGLGYADAVEVLHVVHVGGAPRLLAGGKFSVAGGVPVSNLALWDGQAWSDFGGGVSGSNARVLAIEEFDDGRGLGSAVFVGGRFTSAGGSPAQNLARWDGQAWSASELETVGSTPTVRSLCAAALPVFGGRALSIGGDFEAVGGVPAQRYARLAPCDLTGRLECFGDGSSAACPCGNASAVGDRAGCMNSLGTGGTLRAHGTASLTSDTLSLEGGAMPPVSALYFQGAGALNGGAGVPFGDGLRCLSGPYLRLGNALNVGGTSSYPNLMAGQLAVSIKGQILVPGTRHYQVWYRNAAAFCTSATFNYTNSVEIVWGL